MYDFHEGSDREEDGTQLSIDDNPKARKESPIPATTGSLKLRIPMTTWTKTKKQRQESDVQNGIESLLKASALTNIE